MYAQGAFNMMAASGEGQCCLVMSSISGSSTSPMGVSNPFCRLRGTSCFRGAYGGGVSGLPMLKAGRPQSQND